MIHSLEPPGYTNTLGIRLLKAITQYSFYVFTTGEALQEAEKLGISAEYTRQILMKLTKAGWITRLRGGLYATTGELPGNAMVHPFAVASRLVEPSAISHLSALNFHGLSEQIPLLVTATTSKKFVTPSMRTEEKKRSRHTWEVEGTSYEYVTVKPEHFFGIEEVWIDNYSRIPIFDKERTMLDGFIAPKLLGGIGETLGLLEENLQALNVKKLVEYTLRYGKGAVIKRVGWALDRLGIEPKILKPLQEFSVSSYHLLNPSGQQAGEYERKWMLRNNLWVRNHIEGV